MMFKLPTGLCVVLSLVLLSQSAGSFWDAEQEEPEPEPEEECPVDECMTVTGNRERWNPLPEPGYFSSQGHYTETAFYREHMGHEGVGGSGSGSGHAVDMDGDGVMDCVHDIYDRPGGRVEVSSPKGLRTDPLTGEKNQPHNGPDFPVETGTWLFAPQGGTVIRVVNDIPDGTGSGGGNQILIEHPDGTVSAFLHMKQNSTTLRKGDSVEVGDYLGQSNDTGRTTGPHLHYALRTEEWARDKRPAKEKVKDLNLYHDPEEEYSDCGADD